MNRYRITEQYCTKVWFEKVVDISAISAEQALDIFHEEIDGDITLVYDEEIDWEHGDRNIQDILEISC